MQVVKDVLKQYLPADKFLRVNDRDPNLVPIDIPLPKCPPLHLIDGYGLPAKEQKFKREQMPINLAKIVKYCDSVDDIWTKLYARQREMKSEIDWIKKQWYYRRHGYWFFNNGKPTYITGTHHFYLQWFKIDVGSPKYRDRSRKHFLCMDFLHNYTYDFKEKIYDVKGNRLPNKFGDELEDTGHRTMFGLVYPKMRRAGASYESLAWMLNRITMTERAHSGIQGPDKTHGYRAFKKLVFAWRKLPFFFQPKFTGDNDPEVKLNFINKTTGDFNATLGLETQLTFATTNNGLHYDQEKLLDYLREEPGKTKLDNIYFSWDKIKNTLAQGDGAEIVGFALYPSTAGEMEKDGGENYFYMCRDSNYYERVPSGSTKTGMVLIFIPGDEGLEGYIDEYGMSVTDTPTEEQAAFIKRKIGAREHILGGRLHYLQRMTPEGNEKYLEHCRLYPLSIKDCFATSGGGIGFNEIILDKRMGELRFDQTATRRGNFDWEDGVFLGKVIWNDDPNGRWTVSKLLPDDKTNLRFWDEARGSWMPVNPGSHMHCSDPFNFDETEGSRQSMGGGICIERRKHIQGDSVPIQKWLTPDVVCTYSFRHADTTLFCEDMLMQTLYYGGRHNPESNNEMVRKYFKKHKCNGFLYYYKDEDGKFNKTAGYSLNTDMQTKILGSSVDFIERHGHRCNHLELLDQCKNLRGRKDITNKDLVAVFGGATHAIQEDYRVEEVADEEEDQWDLSPWVKKRRG